ncbi:MAG: glycoside hydrolase family 9 protein [Bacteroidota bacterium]
MKNYSILFLLAFVSSLSAQEALQLNEKEYFHKAGLDVTFFSDYYPEGHQSGVSIIQHGNRVAANGDLRLEPSPGQWSPVPKGGSRIVDKEKQTITQTLWFPDTSKNRVGFNPVIYPDLTFRYQVHISAAGDGSVNVSVDLEEPLPREWIGKAGFNLELFPGDLFGKSFLMDDDAGIFPDQPIGPVEEYAGEILAGPLAKGRTLVVAPESDLQRMVIRSQGDPLELWDGRINHNNGWFIVRSTVPEGATKGAINWNIKPHTIPGWKYEPVIQVSQLGYHPAQEKKAIVELDLTDSPLTDFTLYRLNENGAEQVLRGKPEYWGTFLRYQYVSMDFSMIREPGVYQVAYGSQKSNPFRIAGDIYEKDTWQPTLEYFLPVQMCHMRINEKYRVWHDLCHMDDARMAPPVPFHFDGYRQDEENYTQFKAGDHVPQLDQGGWHDAGDFDLRVESQAGTVWMLALMIEEFGLDHDATMVDFKNHVVEIHQPDGVSDALQQIEHGLASILGGYRSLGRLYRGIIASDLHQYVMLGDAAAMTDNIPMGEDDRWVFTEVNPGRELQVIPGLAAASRVLATTNPLLAKESLETAITLWESASKAEGRWFQTSKVVALSELILATGNPEYKNALIEMKDVILNQLSRCGWAVGHVIGTIDDPEFKSDIAAAVKEYQEKLLAEQKSDSPYGVPYKPNIWGAGWNIQRFGVEQYFYHKGWPGQTYTAFYENALNFILGVHPGSNNASFASGVGSESIKVAYGVNRADWSFIPGGVVSGTALIRPDLPELKTWPYLWQQTEYVMGGGATNYMFLVMAVNALYQDQ